MLPRIAKHGEHQHVTLLLALRLGTLVMLVVLMTLHLRSVRVFRWEQSVSGGLLVTYCIVALGLALCAGANKCGGVALQNTIAILHIVFECFEIYDTVLYYIVVMVYLSGTGAVLLAINAVAIWYRWRRAGDLTHVVAELLESLGVPLERHIIMKVILGLATALALLLELIIVPLLVHQSK